MPQSEKPRASREEVFARIRALPKLNISGADIIRQVRAERDRVIERRLRDSMRRRPAR